MAAIGKIREHYGVLIVIIGLALLAFVLGDLFKSTNRRQVANIAVVNNEKITYQDYSNLVESNLENLKRQNGGNVSNDDSYSIHSNTLDQMIKDLLMSKELERVGVTVSSDELYDQFFGEKPNRYVTQNFQDENGNFDKEKLTNYLQNFQNLSPEYKTAWLNFEKAIKEDRLNTKYENILKKSFYLPAKFAERFYADKNDKYSAEVYAIRYNTIPDSTVVVTESDNKKFYEENKNKYQTDAMRSIDYVLFEVKPSDKDIADALKFMKDIKEEFVATPNVSSFISANSDAPYDSAWKSRKDVNVDIEKEVFDGNHEIGYVVGPYKDGDNFNLVRIVDMAERSDSLQATHILIAYQGALRSSATRTKEEAQALADSLLNVANKKSSDIKELAKSFSDDPSAAENEGDLGWFTDGTMVPTFNEFVQNNKVGTIGLVESPFGFHIIKVTDRTEAQPKARLAILTHEITPSTPTYQAVFAEANKFVTENKTMEQFESAADEQGLNKRTYPSLRETTSRITGIENPRAIVRWAFDKNTKVGDISTIFDLENMYAVAVVTKITEEGLAPYNDIVERYAFQIKKEKKGQILAEKVKQYGTDYDRMIKELNGEKTTVDNITYEGRGFGNFGVEDKVIGSVVEMQEGVYSSPIVGSNAIFVVKITKKEPAAATTDYSAIMREKKSQFTNSVNFNGAYLAVRENAKIVDNSILFY